MPDEQEIKYLRAEVVRMTGQLADARQEGMRNVVEWGDEICPHLDRDYIKQRSCTTCWNAFIKKNGLEEK